MFKANRALSGLLAAALLSACDGAPEPEPATGGGENGSGGSEDRGRAHRFVDIAPDVGLDITTVVGNPSKVHILETLGVGVAVADYDGDGDEDVYVANAQTTRDWLAGRRPLANALYRKEDDGGFTEVAAEAGVDDDGWSQGAWFADYDNDGDKDLFVTAWGPNRLYRNEGDGTFRDVGAAAGVAGNDDDWSTGAAFADLDGDGDLDLYVTNYCVYDLNEPPEGVVWKGIVVMRGPHGLVGQRDRLYRNEGDGSFRDVSEAAGLYARVRHDYGLGVTIGDFDDDSDADIYVANDSRANYLWRNDGGLRFTEIGAMAGVATNEDAKEQAGMGTDAGDYDGDGRLDLVVTNFSHDWNTLYRNRGNLTFVDETFRAGFRDSYMKLVWGVKFFDYDNDGWLDLFMANGHIYPEVEKHTELNTPYRQTNSLYRNRGDGTFENRSEGSGPGMELAELTRGVAVFDYDLDGDPDLALTNLDGPLRLLRNDSETAGSWIAFRLIGEVSNRDAIGARITLQAAGRTLMREVNPYGSFLSQSSHRVHFGLGPSSVAAGVSIRWPSGQVDELGDLEPGKLYEIHEGRGLAPIEEPQSP